MGAIEDAFVKSNTTEPVVQLVPELTFNVFCPELDVPVDVVDDAVVLPAAEVTIVLFTIALGVVVSKNIIP